MPTNFFTCQNLWALKSLILVLGPIPLKIWGTTIYNIFWLYIYLFRDTWIASIFCLLQIMVIWRWVYNYLLEWPAFNSFGVSSKKNALLFSFILTLLLQTQYFISLLTSVVWGFSCMPSNSLWYPLDILREFSSTLMLELVETPNVQGSDPQDCLLPTHLRNSHKTHVFHGTSDWPTKHQKFSWTLL